jgi:hypothetical protein
MKLFEQFLVALLEEDKLYPKKNFHRKEILFSAETV